MASNDVIELVFDGPSVVRWLHVNQLVVKLESLMEGSVGTILRAKGLGPEARGWSGKDQTPRAKLAGPAKRGSVILPLIFELAPVHVELVQLPSLTGHAEGWRDLLSMVSDAVGLLDVALAYTFGRAGFLARHDKPDPQPPASDMERLVQGLVGTTEVEARRWIEDLMAAAERTECSSVRIRFRDELDIELVRNDRGLSNTRLGIARPRLDDVPPGPFRFMRSSDPIQVKHEGDIVKAFVTQVEPTPRGPVILIWRSKAPLPDKERYYEAQGDYVPRSEIEPVDPVPDSFAIANGVFVVRGSRLEQFE